MTQRCGYIAILGRPNAGKSTLLNALVGDKIAVVSRKPQTTRNRILGVAMHEDSQLLFLDSPGLHKGKKNLINSTMNKVAMSVASEADYILYLIDSAESITDEDVTFLGRILEETKKPCLLVLSKIDAIHKGKVAAALAHLAVRFDAFRDQLDKESPWLMSAKRPEEVSDLREYLAEQMPEGPWLFAEDDLTDMPRNFLVSELIREQLFRQLAQEIPYGCAVRVEKLEMKPDIVVVRAQIVLARASHKPIVLGKGGSRIKELGTEARQSLEKHFDQKVFLDLSVTVAENWIDDQKLIAELAHLNQDDFKLEGPQA